MNNKTTVSAFTKDQTSIIKGIGILLILFHNFFHWIMPMDSMENEFHLSSNYVREFLNSFADSPGEFINILFSFLGHYGVEIFIFISGYGLAKSFMHKEKSWGRFMCDRLKKLYPMLLIGIVFYFFSRISMNYALLSNDELKSILYKLLFIHIFIPGETMTINGPWWFFGLIVQLYIFFPLLYKMISKYGFKAFAAISAFSYMTIFIVLNNVTFHGGVTIMQHCIGHFPEFCLGIYLGKKEKISSNLWIFLAALTVFILGNFYNAFFPFTFLSITYIFLFIFIKIINLNPKVGTTRKVMIFIGNISMMLFVTHGMFRWQFVCLAKNYNNPVTTIIFALLFFIEAIIISLAAKAIYDWITGLLNKTKPER